MSTLLMQAAAPMQTTPAQEQWSGMGSGASSGQSILGGPPVPQDWLSGEWGDAPQCCLSAMRDWYCCSCSRHTVACVWFGGRD